jgi:O-antigen ligase
MNRNLLDNYFFLLFSLIPVSIIIGPAISLINILLIDLSFIFLIFYKKNYQFLSNKAVKLILLLCLYLVFNSIISQNFSIGALRNLGFIRFGILFCAFNYFFYYKKSFHKILIVWTIILIILCLDSYIESFSGKNILGYGDEEYGRRIVSFFKDEPIVGSYINAFYLIITGYLFFLNNKFLGKYKYIILMLSVFFLLMIMLTGERSNSIKAFFGFAIFYLINSNFNIKEKFFSVLLIIAIVVSLFFNSEFLRLRFGHQFVKPIINVSIKVFKNFNISLNKENKITIQSENKPAYSTLENSDPGFAANYKTESVYTALYKSSFNVFKDYPIFGVGNKNYRLETCKEITKSGYLCNTHPHQIYFEFLAEHGLIGTIILLLILFSLIFSKLMMILQTKNYTQIGCLLFFLTFFIPLLPSGSFFTDYNLTVFWLNLSLMYAVEKKTNIFSVN